MIEWFVERLIQLIGPLAALNKEKRELADAALRAVSEALTETCLYYRDKGTGNARNLEIEAKLARLWAAAVIPLRHIDANLAMDCEMKSQYWVNPDNWSGSAADELRIGLRRLSGEYRSLIKPDKALF